jgi:hypothetical protein
VQCIVIMQAAPSKHSIGAAAALTELLQPAVLLLP